MGIEVGVAWPTGDTQIRLESSKGIHTKSEYRNSYIPEWSHFIGWHDLYIKGPHVDPALLSNVQDGQRRHSLLKFPTKVNPTHSATAWGDSPLSSNFRATSNRS
jgi:hypothetical protein